MIDQIETTKKGSVIHHGKMNNRVYLMKLKPGDENSILEYLENLSEEKQYSKIFCKIKSILAPAFIAKGFELEAYIPRFYNNKVDISFVSRFTNPNRLDKLETDQLKFFTKILENPGKKNKTSLDPDLKIRKLIPRDVDQIVELYRRVFISYPFPIHDENYIIQTMTENLQYFGVLKGQRIIALSSAEIDFEGQNAEMTDFATDPDHTGKNLSVHLLDEMEKDMERQHITTLYTIARLNSIPMNKTFIRNDYIYSGTLKMNTDISGKIESMNVYYKHLI